MTERLVIDRLAHRGDGVADTPAGPLFVPYTLPGETVEVENVPGHPDRRNLIRIETASPERIAPAWAIAEALAPQKRPLAIQATATDAGIDMDVRGSGPLNSARTGVLARLAEAHKLARLTRHGELIGQRAAPSVVVGRARVT